MEVHLYFSRDVLETLAAVLNSDTILVSGWQNHGWAARKRTLIKRLLKKGYSVVLTEPQRQLPGVVAGVRGTSRERRA